MEAFIREKNIIKIGVKRMTWQKIIFEVCPRCQSTFINRTENENPTWQCSDCFYTFEVPLIAQFPDAEDKGNLD
jgi:ribosomal protein L37AE/L43A